MSVQVLTAQNIADKLDKSAVKAALKSAFAGLHSGASVQPTQTVAVFPGDEGDTIFYPGVLWDAGIVGVKVSPYISGLAKAGKSPVTAYTLLLSVETGEPVLLCDSLALTTIRTAATTSLALDYLIPSDAAVLAVIGSGNVALEHVRFALGQHQWSEARIYSPALSDPAHDRHSTRSEQLKTVDGELTVAKSVEAAVRGADVVLLCTSSGTPVVDSKWLQDVRVITSISTNVPGAHEVDPGALADFDVYCDYKATAPVTAGEMVAATKDHGWSSESIIADLPDLTTGFEMPANGRPAFFRSTGLGIEDLAIASLLY